MSTDLVVPDTGELVASGTLFGTDNPVEVIQRAANVARPLEQLVRQQNLVVRIGQSDHVKVEGWALLGSMLGVFPIVEWTRPVLNSDGAMIGWEARVEARTLAGQVVGSGEAECLSEERTWKGRDDYARRSMAQTRAISKAMRGPLGFVMKLAGFDPTPADEMPVIEGRSSSAGEPTGDASPAQTQDAAASASASPADDVAAGTPFSYNVDEPVVPAGSKSAEWWAGDLERDEPMWRKLNVLVGKLRPAHLSTLHLWQSMGREPVLSEDGELHWSPLRDSLTRREASELIDRLESYAKQKLGEAA